MKLLVEILPWIPAAIGLTFALYFHGYRRGYEACHRDTKRVLRDELARVEQQQTRGEP